MSSKVDLSVRLTRLQSRLVDAKAEQKSLQKTEKELRKQLKDLGIKNPDNIDKALKPMIKKRDKLRKEIEKGLEEIDA